MNAKPINKSLASNTISQKSKRQRKPLSVTEKLWIKRVYDYVVEVKTAECVYERPKITECVVKVGEILDLGYTTIYAVLKELKDNAIKAPKKPGPKLTFKGLMSKETFAAIRQIVNKLNFENESPTVAKVHQVVRNDPKLPNFSQSTMWKILKHLNLILDTPKAKNKVK